MTYLTLDLDALPPDPARLTLGQAVAVIREATRLLDVSGMALQGRH